MIYTKLPRKLKKSIKNNILKNLPKSFKSKELKIIHFNKQTKKIRYQWTF